MNVFGFLATVCGCAAGLGAVWMLTRKPITFKVIKSTETPRLAEPPKANSTIQATSDAQAQPRKKEPVEYASMDAVIKAANELMGITIPDTDIKEDK